MRVWIIAALTLLIQGAFAFVGFIVGLAIVGLYLGYMRAWEIAYPVSLPKQFADEDD